MTENKFPMNWNKITKRLITLPSPESFDNFHEKVCDIVFARERESTREERGDQELKRD